MANNKSTIADPADGHFDDWFELYNPGPGVVDLSGYGLTDNLTTPGAFRIPAGTVLSPSGYLLVWADNEPGQNGSTNDLHVNFRLNKGGEALALLAPNGSVIDSVIYGPQTADVSQGRFPDGTAGPYSFMTTATPGRSNVSAGGPELVEGIAASVTGDTVTITWPAQPGKTYRIQFKNDLNDLLWQTLGNDVLVTGATGTLVDNAVFTQAQRYYRVLMVN